MKILKMQIGRLVTNIANIYASFAVSDIRGVFYFTLLLPKSLS